MPPPAPFWHQLHRFFSFPFQREPLLYGALLALCSTLAPLLPSLPWDMQWVLVQVGVGLALSRYAFKVVALTARGMLHSREFPPQLHDDWVHLPWYLFAILCTQTYATYALGRVAPNLADVLELVFALLLPACVMLLVQTTSWLQAINPLAQWAVVRVVGWPYLLLCFFLYSLTGGMPMAWGLLQHLVSGVWVWPVFNAVWIYFSWVMASLLGYVMYQHHAALGVDGVVSAPDAQPRAEPGAQPGVQSAHSTLDAQVASLVTDGDLQAALRLAYEEQRVMLQDVHAQRRYHQLLLLSDATATLLSHAQRYIDLLVQRQSVGEALKAYRACRQRDAQFVPDSARCTLALAQAQWRDAQGAQALTLLKGFDKRFPGDPQIAAAYELAARVLVQGFGRADKAQPILALLQARYPDSAHTQEVRWLLRNSPAGAQASV